MCSIVRNACFLALLLTATAWGQQDVLTVPSTDYPNIQNALDAASSLGGDVLIEVMPGTYNETLSLYQINRSDLHVKLRAVQGQSQTVIDAQNSPAFTGTSVKNFTLDGFTVLGRRGMYLNDSTGLTVQNCYFHTTGESMFFGVNDPSLSSEVTVVNNTVISGQGTDPSDPSFQYGQAVSMYSQVNWGPGCDPAICDPGATQPPPPTGNHKLIVADNVLRSNGSAVRYILLEWEWLQDGSIRTQAYSNGSLVMTGNDIVANQGIGHNIQGGHGHIIAGNRFHDSTMGASIFGASGGIVENNIFVRNGQGLVIYDGRITPEPISGGMLVRHNTVVNNLGAGIIYQSVEGQPYKGVPVVYNNIVAFNEASGIVAVGYPAGSYSYIPADFQLQRNDVYGNTLKGLNRDNPFVNFQGISNPEVASNNYAIVAVNASLDLSVDPKFIDVDGRNFSLKETSPVINKGATSNPIPSSDFAKALRDSIPDIGASEFVKIPKK